MPLDRDGPPGPAALPNDVDGSMVYVGTVLGQAVVLHEDDPPVAGIGEELASTLKRLLDGPMFCANSDGCSYASGDPLLGVGSSRSGLEPWIVTYTGWDLPAETAAVKVTSADGISYWQRPAGNSVTIRWETMDEPEAPFEFMLYDASGGLIRSDTLG